MAEVFRDFQYPTPPLAVFDEDVWSDFQEHFDKRKVELGSCGRPYGTPCAHEHACIRCPMLSINPKMLPRLDELETDLLTRRQRAIDEGWRGEVEGLDLTLRLRSKRAQAHRAAAAGSVDLGMPLLPRLRPGHVRAGRSPQPGREPRAQG